MGDENVSIALRWDQSGADAPVQAASRLEQLGRAMERVERREPTMVLRALRGEIATMGAEAAGATGPVGRLASSLAMFGVGGAAGLVAVGGLAAIGIEIKKLLDIVPNLETSFKKLNDEFAKMGGPGAAGFARMGAIRDRVEEVSEGDWFTKTIGVLRSLGGGKVGSGALGTYEGINEIEQRTQDATLRNELMRVHAESMRYHADAIKKHAEQLDKQRFEFAKGFGNADLPGAGNVGARLLLDRDNPLKTAAWMAGAMRPRVATDFLNQVGQPTTPEGRPIFAGPLALRAESFTMQAALGERGDRIQKVTLTEQEKRALGIGVGKEKDDTMTIARESGRAVTDLVRGVRSGNVLEGVGGAMSSLGGLKAVEKVAPALGPIGVGVSALGALTGLFASKPKVEVDAYGQQALEQMKQLRGDPLTTQIVVVGGMADMRSVQYALGRLQRRDAIQRLP